MNEERAGKWNISVPCVTKIFRNGKSSHGADRNTFEVMP